MRRRRVCVALVAVALLATGLTACGGNTETPPGDGKATRVEVTETEFTIALSRKRFSPGPHVFVVTNEGSTKHDFVIDGPGVDKKKTPIIPSGGEETLRVNLRKGTYELWCAVGSHRELGMELTMTVGEAPPGPGDDEDDGSY